jgi:hypothetical protein
MAVIKLGLGVCQGLCLVAAFNRNASSVFCCQSRLNQMTIQTIGHINKNNGLVGRDGVDAALP